MKTRFTYHAFRNLALTTVLAYLSLNLAGQTTHFISVTSNKFTPANLTITAGDQVTWTNSGGNHNVNGKMSTFPSNPESFGNSVGSGWTYSFTFNTPGAYDYQCDPHAAMGMTGQITVNPKDDPGPFKLTVNFTGMNPHVGQTLWLAVIDQATKTEIARVKQTASVAFSVEVLGLEKGKSYTVDFFADHNKNGIYDGIPTDHAWRREVVNVSGNTVIDFAHNTTFTNIAWKYKLTVHFTGMTPHLGQKLSLYLIWADTGFYQDTVVVTSVPAATFDINSYEIKPGFRYSINFYADHNKNDAYDSPPTDHAWSLFLEDLKGDTIINFAHNINFINIFPSTSVRPGTDRSGKISLYPNPASQHIELFVPAEFNAGGTVKVYSITGSLVEQKIFSGNEESLRFDLSRYKNGIYLMDVIAGNRRDVLKFVKQ